MSGWGRISMLVGAAVLAGLGCGGRSGVPYGEAAGGDDYGGDAGQGGTRTTTAGRGSFGGSVIVVGGSAGAGPVPVAGNPSTGGYGGTVAIGGYGGIPLGGYGGSIGIGGYGGIPLGGYGGSIAIGGYGGIPLGGYGGVASCGQCLLEACSAPLSQCLQDFGCISILSCVQATGCQAFECYSPKYCRDTIDQWGGPAGPAMRELLQTLSCAVASGCNCN